MGGGAKRGWLWGLLACAWLAGRVLSCGAEDIRPEPKRLSDYDIPGLKTNVFLDTLVPWDIVQLIEFLATQGGLNNIVIAQGVAGQTKLRLSNVAAGDALEAVLGVNGLAYEIRGGIMTIMPDAEYIVRRGRSFYDQRKVHLASLKYVDAGKMATFLGSIKSEHGTIVSDPMTGTLILIDGPDKIKEMVAVVEKADVPSISRVLNTTETRSFEVRYAEVSDMQRQIGDLLTKESGSVRADARTKTLIVTDVPDNMQRIESMVKLFDRRPRQVFIEAKIVEVALDDRFSLGVNWSQFLEGLQPRFALQAASQPGLVAGPVGRLTFNTIVAGQDLELVVEALKDFADTKILSNPQIAVVDGQEALIEVVENQPYKEIKMEAGTTNVTGVSYKFEKVGVQLAVTPRITDEEMISVAIKPEISSISTWYDGPPQQATPVIRKAVAETSVLVKNGVTIIIGGMITDRKDRTTRTVPLLGSVPLLGRFFRNDGVSARNSEIVVFLTPRVITGEEMFPRVRDMSKEPKPLREVGAGARKEPKPVR